MTKKDSSESLESLPNIGPTVARLLERAGITSVSALKRLGSVQAALRIREIRRDDPPCRSMLAGLEGAIRQVRWHQIPKARRDALWEEYQKREPQEEA